MVAREYKELQDGLSIFNPPLQMMVGVPEIIAYRIGSGQSITAPTLAAGMPFDSKREIIMRPLKIATRMQAILSGDTFTITSLHSSEEKVIIPDTVNEWSWRVIPTRSGQHTITLRTSAVIEAGEEKFPYDFPIDEKTVTVQVNWPLLISDILKNSWTQVAAIAGLLSTAAVGIFRYIQRHRGSTIKKKLRTQPPKHQRQEENDDTTAYYDRTLRACEARRDLAGGIHDRAIVITERASERQIHLRAANLFSIVRESDGLCVERHTATTLKAIKVIHPLLKRGIRSANCRAAASRS